MCGEDVFLWVVEIGFERDAGVGFVVRGVDGAEVAAVVFEASLKDDAIRFDRGDGESRQEVLEEAAWGGVGVSLVLDWIGTRG